MDAQSGFKAKNLINRSFNVESYITIIYDANMNPSVSQCKNCWKWEYSTFLYHAQDLKYIKYNGPHKSKHY